MKKLGPVASTLAFLVGTASLAVAIPRLPDHPLLTAASSTALIIQMILIGVLSIQQVRLVRLLGWKPGIPYAVLLCAVWLAAVLRTVGVDVAQGLVEGVAALAAVTVGSRPLRRRQWGLLGLGLALAFAVGLGPPLWPRLVHGLAVAMLLWAAYRLTGPREMVRSLQLPVLLLATAEALVLIWTGSASASGAAAVIRATAYGGLILNSYHQLIPALQDTANAYLAIGIDVSTLLSALDEVFFVATPDQTLLYVSEVARRYGLSPADLRGLKWSDLAATASPPPVTQEYPQLPLFALRHPETGKLLWMEVNAQLTRVDGREFVVGTLRDITQRIVLEERLLESTRLAAVGELSAGIAHNFNNLLASVSVRAEHVAMLTAHIPDTTLHENLDAILSNVNRGAGLTRALLTFARGEPVALQRMELARPVLEAMQQVGTDPRVRHLSIQVQVPTDLVARAHPGHVQQVLVNLLLNAGQATDPGGQVTITGWQEGGKVFLAVRDTGAGIPAEHLRRIFEPFFSTRRESGRGSGLGLSVSLGMMRSMGGDLLAESGPGQGSCFTMVLEAVDAGDGVDRPGRGP